MKNPDFFYISFVSIDSTPVDSDFILKNFSEDLFFVGFSEVTKEPVFKVKTNRESLDKLYYDIVNRVTGNMQMLNDDTIERHIPALKK